MRLPPIPIGCNGVQRMTKIHAVKGLARKKVCALWSDYPLRRVEAINDQDSIS